MRERESEGESKRELSLSRKYFVCVMIISNMQEVEEENVSKEKT